MLTSPLWSLTDHALDSPREMVRIGYPWAMTAGTITEPQGRYGIKGGCYRDNQRRKLTQKEEADDDSGRMLGFNARYVYWLTPGQVFVLISGAIGCPGIRRNWTSRCAVDRMWIRPLNTYRDETTTEVGWQRWRIQNQKMLHTLETPVA
jgi:hypothetical protein